MQGIIQELRFTDHGAAPVIRCGKAAIPRPGQYALGYDVGSDLPLSTVLFPMGYQDDAFIAAPPVPSCWQPGTVLDIRGPLGIGFEPPIEATRIALVAFDDDATRLMPILDWAVHKGASLVLVTGRPPPDLPLSVEVRPMAGMLDVLRWSDYAAIDMDRESQTSFARLVVGATRPAWGGTAQALVRTPIPCAGMASCGACAVRTRHGVILTCLDGPVVDLELLRLEG